MILFPQTRPNRLRIAQVFATVPVVDISIDCVIEDQMGKVFVDSLDNPQFFMIEQDSFFCYLAGDFTQEAGREFLKAIPNGRFLMAGSHGWEDVAKAIFGERLIAVKRDSYSSDSLSMNLIHALASVNDNIPHIKRFDVALASKDNPYLSLGAFDSVEDFVERGIGFCLLKEDVIIGVAYSSLVSANGIEVSIVVDPDHYRKGIATALSCKLVEWCLEHHVAPHWDAANDESCKLAEKLGYTHSGVYTAYFLK
jgi:GNAT superfamily N-acetyltransferase